MATDTAKPVKLTEALVNEYLDEEAKVTDAKAALKPLTDKAKSLYEQIEAAFLKLGKDKRKVGKYVLSVLKKRGSVQWKSELATRLSSDELKAIEAAVPEKVEVEIKEA